MIGRRACAAAARCGQKSTLQLTQVHAQALERQLIDLSIIMKKIIIWIFLLYDTLFQVIKFMEGIRPACAPYKLDRRGFSSVQLHVSHIRCGHGPPIRTGAATAAVFPGTGLSCVIAMAATLVSMLHGGPQFLYALLLGVAFTT